MQQKDIENRKLRDIVHVREMEIVDLKEDRDRLIRLYNT
jgi:hypothetical protein